jgi:hypothetical protein
MRNPKLRPLALTALVLLISACELSGQRIRRSQLGSVSQRIADTEVTIVYSRPVARGRTLFGPGGVVAYDEAWNPGADTATSIEFSTDVTINGEPLQAGEYSLWAIPREDSWTVIFSSAADVWHIPYPGENRDAVRLEVATERGAHMETMTYYFPVVDGKDAVLRFHWGETIVSLSIRAP